MIATETRPVDPGDPYVDPPRNWKRVGLIAASLAALWVVVGALGWVTMQVPQLNPEDPRVGTNTDPEATVRAFFGQAYGRGDLDVAQAYVKEGPEDACGSQGPPDPAALRSEWSGLEAQYGPEAPVLTKNAVNSSDGRASVNMTVDFGVVAGWNWELLLFDEDGWWICGYSRTQVVTPAPDPSGS